MALVLTNTLTRKKEAFVPLKAGEVKMYVCGPTVYNFIHIGNARPLIFFDVVARFLRFQGFKVTRVMNYTDVDDKIIAKALEEKTSAHDVAERYTQEYEKDSALLGVIPPDLKPKVSENIPAIIKLIEKLIANGAAYLAPNGEVFYSIRHFKEYGKLSGKKVDELLVGARVDVDEKKKDPLDFSLWKPRKVESEISWDSPWGPGRPGWHIECSAMVLNLLGETIDIHGGGLDLIHPHHENEIAQSEAATKRLFARYWLHNNLLTVKSEKMSKSVGNVWLTRDFIEKFGAETLKFFLLSAHYRSTVDFSEKQIREHQAALHRIYSTLDKCEKLAVMAATDSPVTPEESELLDRSRNFREIWLSAMEDDFNTPKVTAAIFDYVRAVNAYLDKKGFRVNSHAVKIAQEFQSELRTLSSVLNLFSEKPAVFLEALRDQVLNAQGVTRAWVQEQIELRKAARVRKDFAESDRLRDLLKSKGVLVKDLGPEMVWDIDFSSLI